MKETTKIRLIDKIADGEEMKKLITPALSLMEQVEEQLLKKIKAGTDKDEDRYFYRAVCKLYDHIESIVSEGKVAEKKLERGNN